MDNKIDDSFRILFEQSPLGSVVVGLDKKFQKCNSAFCKFIGYSEDELVGKTIADITHPDDIELGMNELKLMAEGKMDIAAVEKRYVHKNGSTVWGQVSISIVRDSKNIPMYFLPVIRDITEKKNAEAALKESEEKLRLVMDGVTVPIVFVSADLRYDFVNKAYADWYNTTKKDIEGKYIKDILAEDVYKRALPNYQAVLNGQRVSFSNNVVKDGKEKFVNVRMIPHYNGDKIVGFLSSIFDITEIKHAEFELKKKNRELEETNSIMVNRELKMIELKKEVNELLKMTGKDEKYEC
ncbi:MAG: PAS domain S-box protein [Candidatus Delongbacteria bacterium]|nr:PAS domain S-box protein [Candidatus Delongbacteria bacterium]